MIKNSKSRSIKANFTVQQRHDTENLKQIFPEKELSVSDLDIPRIGLPILLQANMWTDPGNV
jgi:hypothetical protein